MQRNTNAKKIGKADKKTSTTDPIENDKVLSDRVTLTTPRTWNDIDKNQYLFDELKIGTEFYDGLGWFWNYEYRHYLRDVSLSKRKKIHNKLMISGLDVSGESDEHLKIIRGVIRK